MGDIQSSLMADHKNNDESDYSGILGMEAKRSMELLLWCLVIIIRGNCVGHQSKSTLCGCQSAVKKRLSPSVLLYY